MSEFTYKRLLREDLKVIESLQNTVIEALEDSTILQPLSRDELLNILNGNGIMLGAFINEELVGCRALLFPQPNEKEHLGLDAHADNLAKVLYQEVSFVSPSCRGKGLQRKLGEKIMQHVDLQRFDLVCATVKPFNIASLKDKFSQGLYVVALKLKYGGKLRYVFAKHLHQPLVIEAKEQIVFMKDIEKQQQLLKQNYVGTKLTKLEDEWAIVYQFKKA